MKQIASKFRDTAKKAITKAGISTHVRIVVIAMIMVVGIAKLILSHAATAVVSFDAESGTVASPASSFANTAANNGQAVKFIQQSTGSVTYGPRVTPGLTTAEASLPACSSGSELSTTANNQVIQNCKVTQNWVVISHKNVTFKNVLFLKGTTNGGGQTHMWDSSTFDTTATAGIHFVNVEFRDVMPVIGSEDSANPAVIQATVFKGTSDGYGDTMKGGSNILVEDSYFKYSYTPESYAHSDGIQSDYGDVNNVTVRYSYFELPTIGANRCLFENEATVNPSNSHIPQNWLIENNICNAAGAPYAFTVSNTTSASVGIVFRNNKVYNYSGGPLQSPSGAKYTWTGNVNQSGQTINP